MNISTVITTASATASANGFAFERRIGYILNQLKSALLEKARQNHIAPLEQGHQNHIAPLDQGHQNHIALLEKAPEEQAPEEQAPLEKAPEEWIIVIHDEQEIRDFFKEQSLNGVDHMVQIQDPTGQQHLFLIQEKWKVLTNQREVSQFLDCCARILARMPDYKGLTHRLWVSRTVPSLNGDKSLQEGQCIVVQTCTSQTMLAVNTLLMICELLGNIRSVALGIIEKLGSLLPSAEEAIVDPKVTEEQNTFEPVSNFGEKRVLPITKQTVVTVKKCD